MTKSTLAVLMLLAGCPSEPTNPAVLWLVPTNGEQDVALSGTPHAQF